MWGVGPSDGDGVFSPTRLTVGGVMGLIATSGESRAGDLAHVCDSDATGGGDGEGMADMPSAGVAASAACAAAAGAGAAAGGPLRPLGLSPARRGGPATFSDRAAGEGGGFAVVVAAAAAAW